jgi:hypothetical protein
LKRGLYILLGLKGTYRPAVMIEQISKLVRDNAQLRSENDKLRGKIVRKNVLRCSISCPTFGLNLSEETTSYHFAYVFSIRGSAVFSIRGSAASPEKAGFGEGNVGA